LKRIALWYLRRTWPDQKYTIYLTPSDKYEVGTYYAVTDSWEVMKKQVSKAKNKGYTVLKVTAVPDLPEEVVYQPGRTEK